MKYKNNKKIFLSPPHMSGKELGLIKKVFKSNYIAPAGEFITQFEDSIKDYTKAKYALCVNSGTSAIHLALRVVGVQRGDEVLSSSFTFIGSSAPILYQGATPIFIDSDNSWNMSVKLFKKAMQKRQTLNQKMPKALILTHLYGQLAKIQKIANICKKYKIILIEDCAESLGAFYKNKHCGLFGDIGIFSFNGNKIITTSGGGAMISDNEKYIQKAKYFATTARQDELFYEHFDVGYNYRMSNVLASIGVAQMKVLEKRVNTKREIFETYKHLLRNTPISFMPEIKHSRGTRWLSTINLKQDYKPFVKALEKNNYESRPLWKPMHLQKVFKNTPSITNNKSQKLFNHGLCLPSGGTLKLKEIKDICNIIKKHL